MKIRKGDNIIVISGKDKGKSGKVELAFPAKNQVIIANVNMHKKHERAKKSGQKGQVVQKAYPIHVSNVMIADPNTGKATRIRMKIIGEKKIRVAIKSGKEL